MDFSHLHTIPDLQFIPVNAKKLPVVKEWQTSPVKHDLSNREAVGLVCGRLSGNLEALDIDTKYDLTGQLFERYKKLIHEANPQLLTKLVVQKTQSGGYHFIYRCQEIEGNLKLANRPTTVEEKKATYEMELNNGATVEKALKVSSNDKVRVLLETRGIGGYIKCFPSDGYELIYGDYYGINEISVEDRETLHNIARQFDETIEVYKPGKKFESTQQNTGLSPLDDYDQRGDCVGLLETYGWKFITRKGAKVVLLRPGQTTSASSANFDEDKNWFSVFTTSTEFEPQKAYKPSAVYAVLECNGDFKEAHKKLYEQGYGDRKEAKQVKWDELPAKTKEQKKEDEWKQYEILNFFATEADTEDYLRQARDGTLPMGLTTGFETLDKHFLFKQGNMVISNGVDNVGKTAVSLYLAFLSSIFHGWNWIIFSSENTLGSIMRRFIEYYWGRKISTLNDIQFDIAKKFILNHFDIIKTEEDLFSYKDILNMCRAAQARAKEKNKKYNACYIDPYNSLKIDMKNYSKLSTHEYHYEAISEVKAYGKQTDLGFWISNHAITGAIRHKSGDGYTIAPGKEDTEGGNKFPAKADDFITYHRHTGHPTEWMYTELHIRKIKETETGGRPTIKDNPVKLRMNENSCGFREVQFSGLEYDPVEEWHNKNKTALPPEIRFTKQTWTPLVEKDHEDETPF